MLPSILYFINEVTWFIRINSPDILSPYIRITRGIKNKKLTETEVMDEIIKQLLGEKAFKEIEAMDLPITSYKVIYFGIMSAISGESYEETEARFQKKAK